MSNESNQNADGGTPFKCMQCKEIFTTQSGDWPNECPECGSIEWMTTMDAMDDGADDLDDEVA